MDEHSLLVEALKRVIPVSSLPMNYPDHATLADALVLELNAKLVIVSKGWFDENARELQTLHRYREAVIGGL